MSAPATIEDVLKLFQETNRRFQETNRQFQETDRRFQETDRRFQETDRRLRQLSEDIGRLGNRLGEFVEGMVAPAVVRLFQARGIPVHEVHQRVAASRQDVDMEVDLLVVNDEDVVAIEVKSKVSVADVDDFVEQLGHFKRAFPHYRDAAVMGGYAGMVIPIDVARYAYRQGLFVIGQRGETVEILNDQKFQPRAW